MAQILMEHARKKRARKRGGDRARVGLDGAIPDPGEDLDLTGLQEALDRLEEEKPRQAKVVFLHFFAGQTIPETAELLDLSPRTVNNDWRLAKVWLKHQISKGDSTLFEEGPR